MKGAEEKYERKEERDTRRRREVRGLGERRREGGIEKKER